MASQRQLTAVVVHCNEPILGLLRELRAESVSYVVYHKSSSRCTMPDVDEVAKGGRLVVMPHNLGRECTGYLRYIVDHYAAGMSKQVAFLQAGAELHLRFQRYIWPALSPLIGHTSGYIGLSKNSFEGSWPAPCESKRHITAFKACHQQYWEELSAGGPEAGQAPPATFRFYANALFVASAERIRSRPLALYRRLLDRLEGRLPLLCTNSKDPLQAAYANWANDTHRMAPSEIDCLMLEKTWHILLNEPSTMPPPQKYDTGGGRYPTDYITSIRNRRISVRRHAQIICSNVTARVG